MKAIIKVSHLRTDDALYCRGDTVDFPEERIVQLGSSVERIDAIVETPQETEDETVADDTANESESGTDDDGAGDTDTSGNEPVSETDDEAEVVDSTDVEEEDPVKADKPKQKRGRPKR